MKKGFLPIGLFMAFALLLCVSCEDDETAEWKDFDFAVTSNLAAETGTIPYEGAAVVFTVTTNGRWTYAIDQSKTDWFTQPTVDGNTLSVIVPENTVSKERSGVIRFISVSDPTLAKEFNLTQDPSPEAPKPQAPKADLLDVVFHADGTAEDVSPLKNEVIYYPGSATSCYYHEAYRRMVTNYTHTPGQNTRKDSYYRVDYYTNETFKAAVDDGHSLEVVFRSNKNDGTKEYKPFAAHQGGGTGFLISKENQADMAGEKHAACITFLPNVTTTGKSKWIWCMSDVYPEVGRYYHVVGVYDKTEGKASIYVDGELKSTVDAPGDLLHATEGSRWFGIGGDSANGSMGNAWNGEVVLARVFDEPLNEEQVALLYEDAKYENQKPAAFSVTNLTYLPQCEIGAGYVYTIYGNGFESGDRLRFTSTTDVGTALTLDAALTEPTGDNTVQSLSVTIPAEMPTGENRFFMTLVRDGCQYPLGIVGFTVSDNPRIDAPRIIAHRGQHQDGVDNSTENSIAALANAQKLGIHGAEFDVWITTDNVPVINHNATVTGSDLRIEESTYAQIKDLKLANGEPLPTFDAYLEQGAKDASMKLICEIKSHATPESNTRAVTAVVAAVKARSMESRVDYIAFDYEVCKQLAAAMPSAKVQYLGGDKAPADVAKDGLAGIDYQYSTVLSQKPEWVKEAHTNGIEVNAWTVNTTAQMIACIGLGVDYITTDNPATLKKLLEKPFVTAPK